MKYITVLAVAGLIAACNAPGNTPAESTSRTGDATGELASPEVEAVAVEGAEFRLPLGDRDVSAGFLTLRGGAVDLKLVAVSTPAAETSEIHTHMHVDGKMAMRKVDALTVPADGELVLRPGGDHLMFFGVIDGLVLGETVPVTLTFEQPGGERFDVTTEFTLTDIE